MYKMIFLIALASMLLAGCAATSSVAMPSSYEAAGQRVTATKSHPNFLLLIPSSNNDDVLLELAGKCPSGKVTNVTASYSSRYLFIIWLESITLTGECVE